MIFTLDWLWQVCLKIIELGQWAWNFLQHTFVADFGVFGQINVSVWALLSGVGLTTLVIYRVIK